MKYFRTQVVNLKINPGMMDILDFLIQKIKKQQVIKLDDGHT